MSLVTLPNPSIYPKSMVKYGLNPYGEPLWRVVYAPSVKKLVGGRFSDGYVGYRARKAYEHLGNCWVLEKWLSGWEFTRQHESDYVDSVKDSATGLLLTGPYPSRGIYYMT